MTRVRGVIIAAALLLLAGCVSSSVSSLPKPPRVSVLPTTTSIPDFSGTSLPSVGGTTTTSPVAITGGKASIRGRVTSGGVPAGGATVRIERFVGDQSKSVDVTAGADGVYDIDNVQGGRYRVRAFRPPTDAMTQAQVIFVGATETRALDLALSQFTGGVTVSANIAPDSPELGEQANIAVQLTTRGVDSAGVVRAIPAPGVAIAWTTGGGRVVVSTNPGVTDGNGKVTWRVVCAALEGQQLAVTLPDGSQHALNLASCRLPPPTTTTEVVGAAGTTQGTA